MTEEILHKAHDYARNNIERTEEGGYDIIEEMRLVDAYLAGTIDNTPQWHKVANGDLPKRDERFLTNISIAVMTQDNEFAFYSFDKKKWYSRGIEISNVIAWCEIPKYIEEKSNTAQEIINKPVTLDIKLEGFGKIESTLNEESE